MDGYTFTVSLNPLRKITNALKVVHAEHPNDAKLFLGGLTMLKAAGHIKSFEVVKTPTPVQQPPAPAQ